MSDDKSKTDGRDRAWVGLEQDYEVQHAAEQFLSTNGYPQSQANISNVAAKIRTFPSDMKQQGRVLRITLMDWLRQQYSIR